MHVPHIVTLVHILSDGASQHDIPDPTFDFAMENQYETYVFIIEPVKVSFLFSFFILARPGDVTTPLPQRIIYTMNTSTNRE